jgi:hypothetical protein
MRGVYYTDRCFLTVTGEVAVKLLDNMNGEPKYMKLCQCCSGYQTGSHGDNKNIYKAAGFVSASGEEELPDELSGDEKEALRIRYHNAVQAFKKRARLYYIKDFTEFYNGITEQIDSDLRQLEAMLIEYAKSRAPYQPFGLGKAEHLHVF